MVDKISVEIGLEGGEEVTRQLADIGKAGEKAFGDIQGAADKVNLDSTTSQFDDLSTAGQAAFQKIQTAAQSAVVFENVIQGIRKVEGAFEALSTAATRMATRMTKSLGIFGVLARSFGPIGIAAGIAAGALVRFGDQSADSINKLTASGAKLGLTAGEFDKVQKALTQAGISADDILPGLEKLKQEMSQGIISTDVATGLRNFISTLENMPDSVLRTNLAMQTLGEGLGAQVITGLQTGTISANNFAAALGRITPVTQQQIAEAAKYQQAMNTLNSAWNDLKLAFAPILTPVFGLLTQEIQNLKSDIQELVNEFRLAKAFFDVFVAGLKGEDVGAAAKRAVEAYRQLTQGMGQAEQQVRGLGDALNQNVPSVQQLAAEQDSLNRATQQATETDRQAAEEKRRLTQEQEKHTEAMRKARVAAFEAAGMRDTMTNQLDIAAYDPANSPFSFASGGLMGGSGTGTSDSNLAWLSRGEYITPARAVAQPGVLSFLEALRRSGGNLSRVLDSMGHFALGGLVPRMPAFAAGGLAGGSNVTIQFPGLPAISGLRASSDVVDQLHKAAALAQVRSGGRKPSRYA